MNIKNDFQLFARDFGVSSSQFQNSLTPYILVERTNNMVQMDVFSKLMEERIIWISGPVTDTMAVLVQAQLMYLDNMNNNDITIHIDTPGGSVAAGLSMVDVIDYIKSDVRTINTGMAASMGSVLLGAGTKGKRHALRFSRTMLHQSSGGVSGNIQDARITIQEWEKYNTMLFDLLGGYCGKDPKQVLEDSTRDFWLNAQEAVEYGIIDSVIQNKK